MSIKSLNAASFIINPNIWVKGLFLTVISNLSYWFFLPLGPVTGVMIFSLQMFRPNRISVPRDRSVGRRDLFTRWCVDGMSLSILKFISSFMERSEMHEYIKLIIGEWRKKNVDNRRTRITHFTEKYSSLRLFWEIKHQRLGIEQKKKFLKFFYGGSIRSK